MKFKITHASFTEKILFGCGIFLFVAVFFLIIFSKNGAVDLSRLTEERGVIFADIKAIQSENNLLLKEIHCLKHDLGYIEHVAKHELGMIGGDELVFKIMRNTGKGAGPN